MTVAEIVQMMEQIAPAPLSEAWDNTGLLLGDMAARAGRIMTCLTVTPETAGEAIDGGAELIISHHPLPFKPLGKITTHTLPGRLVWQLATHRIGVYSPHTAWDSAMDGINAQLARKLSLIDIEPLIPNPRHELGAGRCGRLSKPAELAVLAHKLSQSIPHCRLRAVATSRPISRVALACGSGGSFLAAAAALDCQLLVTGEATFHTCLEAQALGMGLLMLGHFASEKFAMDQLAARLASALPGTTVWSSTLERDPVTAL
jgi:dinuclear metal center YbgI/SA1388 family protein